MVATIMLSSHYITALQNLARGNGRLVRRDVIEMEIPESKSNSSFLDNRIERESYQCPVGYFRLNTMNHCRPWLDCSNIEDTIQLTQKDVGNGLGKMFSKAELDGMQVAFIRTREDKLTSDKIVNRVRQGFNNLKMLQPHPRVTQLLGYCIAGNITVMITELGTWGDLRQFLLTNTFKEFSMAQRTDIALQVTDAIGYIHNSPGGSKINCDMNTVGQALAQFIVLEDFRVVLNDVDDLPAGDSSKNIKSQCVVGRHNINSSADHSFEAPERRWPWPDKYPKEIDPEEFSAKLRGSAAEDYSGDIEFKSPQVDEKSDIWKLPDLIEKILISGIPSEGVEAKRVKAMLSHLKPIMRECKAKQPEKRPTAKVVSNHLYRLEKKLENLGW
jgi:serine/threonine protein kinase